MATQHVAPAVQAYLEKLLVKAGVNQIPSSWLQSVDVSKLAGVVPAAQLAEADPLFAASPAAGLTAGALADLGALPGRVALLEADGAAMLVTLSGHATRLDALEAGEIVPAFAATESAPYSPGAAGVYQARLVAEVFDTGGDFVPGSSDPTYGTFTAPRAGIYAFHGVVDVSGLTGAGDYAGAQIEDASGAVLAFGGLNAAVAGTTARTTVSLVTSAAAGATFRLAFYASAAPTVVAGTTRFQGVYLGRAS